MDDLKARGVPGTMQVVSKKGAANSVEQIKNWFEKAVPTPDARNIHTQMGVHIEEFGEMMTSLQEAGSTFANREEMHFAENIADFMQRRFKGASAGDYVSFQDVDRISLLDSLCDQIVTAIGVAHMLNMDITGALQEVAASNDSKFDTDGTPIFDDQKKIMKGPHYFKPDLTRYV